MFLLKLCPVEPEEYPEFALNRRPSTVWQISTAIYASGYVISHSPCCYEKPVEARRMREGRKVKPKRDNSCILLRFKFCFLTLFIYGGIGAMYRLLKECPYTPSYQKSFCFDPRGAHSTKWFLSPSCSISDWFSALLSDHSRPFMRTLVCSIQIMYIHSSSIIDDNNWQRKPGTDEWQDRRYNKKQTSFGAEW